MLPIPNDILVEEKVQVRVKLNDEEQKEETQVNDPCKKLISNFCSQFGLALIESQEVDMKLLEISLYN